MAQTPTVGDKSKVSDKPGVTNNTNDPSSAAKKTTSGKVRVEVVNASGIADAGDKIASILKGQGIEVTGVNSVSNGYKSTVIISNTADSNVVNKLTGLPFKYSLQVINDDGKSTDAVVVIGKDYTGK